MRAARFLSAGDCLVAGARRLRHRRASCPPFSRAKSARFAWRPNHGYLARELKDALQTQRFQTLSDLRFAAKRLGLTDP
jgi:hypothetical protein